MADKPCGSKVSLNKNQILVESNCGRKLASSEGQDLAKDGELAVEAGKGPCGWCKKEVEWPEVRVKIFR